MYKRLSMVLFPVFLLALVGVGFWGYQEHQEKNSVLIKAENQYQRAFHDLSFHVERLQTELGNTLAVNSSSPDAYKKGLINVWRITSQAQGEINQLPLTLLPFNKTEEMLSNTSKFAYQAAVRDLSKQPLSEDEKSTLTALYEHSKEISKQLRETQDKVLSNNLRWMDVEMALATQKEPQDNTIIDGFTTVDKKVSEYSDLKFSPSSLNSNKNRNTKIIGGQEASPEEVKDKAGKLLGIADTSQFTVVENGANTDYNTYSVTGPMPNTTDGVHMDFSKNGGELLWFSASRDVPEKKLDMRQARDAAAQFLDTRGYPGMTATSYQEYNNVANINFATKKGDVINYLEKLTVNVALDNGDMIGMQANDFAMEHHAERTMPKPTVSAEEAKKSLNPNFVITGEALALIRNELEQEVLCHQFTGKINGSAYRFYINAETGAQERVDNLYSEQAQPQPQPQA
ncbi:germination protein YpeB [Paenibacillus thalictri]|uniref:Germination protein YpeB n=1 Tax=Paenibacillus thalictri TaxID=2527873 RepID=A0A4Q9DSC4_9BACL|nr:germination protein YpeB [Paenibacillus thalictri]TBL79774.1 germination protein YpeB [Paenibacillus thalictri]